MTVSAPVVREQNIPLELKTIHQWVCWKPVEAGDKIKKVPVNWRNPLGDGINAHDPLYWGTFEQCLTVTKGDLRFGVGIVLDGTGIICLDLDRHAGHDAVAAAKGEAMLNDMLSARPTYSQTSQSGTGRHVFYRATLPHGRLSGKIENHSLEIFAAKFIAMTGDSAWGTPAIVADGQSIVDAWNIPAPVAGSTDLEPTRDLGRSIGLSDADVVLTLKMRRAATFELLATGSDLMDRSACYAKIIGDLDKITGDPAQIDRIIRKAPMFQNSYNRERYEREGRWLERKSCSSMLDYWLKDARASNTQSIQPYEHLTPERMAFLQSIVFKTAEQQENDAEAAAALRTIESIVERAEAQVVPASDFLIRDNQNKPVGFDYPHPHDPWAMFDPPSLPHQMLPQVIEYFARERAEIIGCDESGLAMASLTVCAAAITDRIQIRMKRHDARWHEAARMWVSLVGDPSIKKSPIISEASYPLDCIEKAARAKYIEELKQYEALSKDEKDTAPRPVWKRRIIEDTTIEALQNVLHENTECMLCRRDELSSWFGSMDRYSGGGKGASADRGFWLQAYNGGGYVLDRVGRGNKYIEYLSVNILGGIQPDVLKKVYKETEDDGTMQRLFPVILRKGGVGRDVPENGSANNYRAVVSALYYLTGADIVGGSTESATLVFDDEAQGVFEEVRAWNSKLECLETVNKKLATAIGKWDGVFGRLALLFHLIDHASVPHTGERPRSIPQHITGPTARRVWDFMRVFLLQHLLAFHKNVMGTSDMQDDVSATADFLLACGKARVTIRDIQRGVQRKDATHDSLVAAMEQLEAYGWVDRAEGVRKDSLAWFVNAECHRRFARKAAEVRKAREASRMAIEAATAIRRAEASQLS